MCACMQVFASHAQFKDWFSNPLLGMVEGETINKVTLHPHGFACCPHSTSRQDVLDQHPSCIAC